jgi:hypothetical protein
MRRRALSQIYKRVCFLPASWRLMPLKLRYKVQRTYDYLVCSLKVDPILHRENIFKRSKVRCT